MSGPYPLAIPVWRYHRLDNKFRDFVARSIVYFTGYPYTHVGLFLNGKLYDSTLWEEDGKLVSGVRVTVGWPEEKPDFCMVPVHMEPTQLTLESIQRVLNLYVNYARPYNFLKLVALALVWPTRWVWRKLGWVPFDHEIYGEVCSGFVDEVIRRAGWDLFPNEHEGYTVPGQFIRIRGWSSVPTEDVYPVDRGGNE